jgi:hypothetical protein
MAFRARGVDPCTEEDKRRRLANAPHDSRYEFMHLGAGMKGLEYEVLERRRLKKGKVA